MIQEILLGIFSLENLLMANIGLAVGIIIGALPGLNPARKGWSFMKMKRVRRAHAS